LRVVCDVHRYRDAAGAGLGGGLHAGVQDGAVGQRRAAGDVVDDDLRGRSGRQSGAVLPAGGLPVREQVDAMESAVRPREEEGGLAHGRGEIRGPG
jgi:hypothetical protein